jgi:hypothetical protein
MLRRSTVEQIRGFDESYFLYYEETDLCLRARRAGITTWYVPASHVMHIAGQSTKVTERDAKPKRLPSYLFESRRRYFMVTQGLVYAILVDIVAVFANVLGKIKRAVTGKSHEDTPNFITDLAGHSILLKKNRDVPSFSSALPPEK